MIIKGFQFRATYEHRVQAKRNGVATDWAYHSTEMPYPFLGRQADHTVQYVVGTPAPTGTTTGVPIPDPDDVLASSLPTAAAAWNNAVAGGAAGVRVCADGQCPGPHDDQRVLYVNIVPPNRLGPCTGDRACIRAIDEGRLADSDGHMKSLALWIAQPGVHKDIYARIIKVYIWTDDPTVQGREVMGVEARSHPGVAPKWGYLPQTLMHELGHAIGLHDLYEFRQRIPPTGYLMDTLDFDQNPGITAVPTADAAQVEDVYDGHTPTSLTP